MIKLFDKTMHEKNFDINEYQLNLMPLDNFSSFGLTMDGKYFQTGEHAFQYLKFFETDLELAEKIRNCYSPNEARNIAHENKKHRDPNWSNIKYSNMKKVFRLKANQNPIVMEKLLETKDLIS